MCTYEQESISQHTPISFEVPEGGYFTISNNFAESPGTFLYNTSDILFDAMMVFMEDEPKKSEKSDFLNLTMGKFKANKGAREKWMKVFEETLVNEIDSFSRNIISNRINDACAELITRYENALNSLDDSLDDSLDISWKHLFQTAIGAGEDAFYEFAGPAGVVLEYCFKSSEAADTFLQVLRMATSINKTYVTVYTSIEDGEINPHGVFIKTNENVDDEAVLQVFRFSDEAVIETVLDSTNPLEKYEMYNICFVKNDKLVQPNGKVKVYIPIPEGMKRETCRIFRQESNGDWTILDMHFEGNYLVFETDHFSLYAVIGDVETLRVSTLPDKITYVEGDILETEGLSIDVGGILISEGYICEPTILSERGTQKITVKYGQSITEFMVNVECAHSDTVTVPAKESTCQAQGNEAYTFCNDCNTIILGTDEKLPFAEHIGGTASCKTKAVCTVCGVSYGEYAEHNYAECVDDQYLKSEANCVEKAVYYKSCDVCGLASTTDTFENGMPNVNRHIGETYIVGNKEATCTQTGYTGDTYCKACDEKISDGKVIDKIDHEYEADYRFDKEKHWKECNCGSMNDGAVHSFGDWTIIKEASFIEKGYKEKLCLVCQYKITEEIPTLSVTQDIEDDMDGSVVDDEPKDNAIHSPLTTDDSNFAVWILLFIIGVASIIINKGKFVKL